MKAFLVIIATAALIGCGVETASTAATAGSIKKQELQRADSAKE